EVLAFDPGRHQQQGGVRIARHVQVMMMAHRRMHGAGEDIVQRFHQRAPGQAGDDLFGVEIHVSLFSTVPRAVYEALVSSSWPCLRKRCSRLRTTPVPRGTKCHRPRPTAIASPAAPASTATTTPS